MLRTIFLAVGLLFAGPAFCQTNLSDPDAHYIEVTGTAEEEVVPDEIYISIELQERVEGKAKITVTEQEDKLKKGLQEIGIDISNLSLSDANSDYVKVKLFSKEIITQQDYSLKVSSAELAGRAFQMFYQIDIRNAQIYKTDFSRMDSLERAVKINAIKSAKAQADYLLGAIGEHTGRAIIVRDVKQSTADNYANIRGARNEGTQYYINGIKQASVESFTATSIQFSKIKVQDAVYVKFAIK